VIQHREIVFALVSGLTAVAAIIAMPMLVASPKLLFGRSLSAIAPSLFPYVTLSFVFLFSACLILIAWRRLKLNTVAINGSISAPDSVEEKSENDWIKKSVFFVLLTGYALLLKPIGFFLSSFLVIACTSVILGNRHWLQIALLAAIAPMCLYLVATRAMLVSLPELNAIELLYSKFIAWLSNMVAL